jgi:hypothetical protein
MPVVLYGCETWSVMLREEHRQEMLEDRLLKKIFGPKRDEVTGEWRRLHNEELHDLYCLPHIIWVIKKNEMGSVCGIFGGKGRCIQDFGRET